MPKVKPSAPRFQSQRTAQGVRLTLRRRWTPFNVFLVVFVGAWLGGWVFGEAAAIRALLGEDAVEGGSPFFVAFWLVGWTAAGVVVFYAWFWNLIGCEVVEVGGGSLRLQKVVGPMKRDREFELEQVKDLRVTEPSPWSAASGWGLFGNRLGDRGIRLRQQDLPLRGSARRGRGQAGRQRARAAPPGCRKPP